MRVTLVFFVLIICFLIYKSDANYPNYLKKNSLFTTKKLHINNKIIVNHVNKRSFDVLLNIRGGNDEYEDEEDEDFDDFDDFSDGHGQQNRMVSSVTDLWVKTPLITQIYVGASLLVTIGSWAINKNQWPDILYLSWPDVLKGQLWRPFTAFLFYGPFGLNYILTIQFVWTYMAQLEKLNYHQPEEFLVMMLFGAATLMVGYATLGFSSKFLGHNLSTFLVYIWARVFEGTEVNVMDLFLLKAELLPWFFCAQTLVLEGEIPFADIMGIVVGHFYHYLSQKKIVKAPRTLKNFFGSDEMKKRYAKFKDDFE